MAQVTLNNVRKTFPGNVDAVRDFNLAIDDGEFLVLVGPSGCGKSTTLRMIAGLEEVTSGTITIGDRIVNDTHPKDRDIAMVFQNYALYPHMNVYKNMAFALRLRKIPRADIDRKVHRAAEILGIENLLHRKPKALSGGQRQRVAVGRAIVRDPKAFLFDEPLSNLDAKLRVEMRAELKRLHMKLKTTTVYVTHDQEEAMTLGDRVVVMNQGSIQQIGSPLEVYRTPRNRFVAGFLGTPPMNFLNGRIEKSGPNFAFMENGNGGIKIPLPSKLNESLSQRKSKGEITLGIRPEAIHPHNAKLPNAAEVKLKITVIEPLGDRMDVYLESLAGIPMVARIPSTNEILPNSESRFIVDAEQVHLFETGDDGTRIDAESLCTTQASQPDSADSPSSKSFKNARADAN